MRRWIFHTECLDDLDHIKHFQRSDFKDLFVAMNGKDVTIRLLDPPLHEFLPRPEQVHERVAEECGFGHDVKRMLARIDSMHEENPMLGLRGCSLGIVKPEFIQMQVEAIMSAAADFTLAVRGVAATDTSTSSSTVVLVICFIASKNAKVLMLKGSVKGGV